MTISLYTLINNPDSDPIVSDQPENKSVFNKEDINAGSSTPWGWKFFKKVIGKSYDIVETINIATELNDEEFKLYRNYVEYLTNNNVDGFFRLYFSSEVEVGTEVDEFRVFCFASDIEVVPLMVRSADEKKRDALDFYKEIVKIISAYRKSSMWAKGQVSLNCICEDNIYLSKNKDKAHIKILPMVNKEKFNNRDINTDLYDAAYLYFKLKYPNGEAFEDNETDQFIERSLSPFKSRQPSLEEIENFFNLSGSDNNRQTDSPKHITDDNPPKPVEDTIESHDKKGINDYVKGVVHSAGKKFKDFVFGKISEINHSTGEDDGTIEE